MDEPPKKQREPMTPWKLAGIVVGIFCGLAIGVLSGPTITIFPASNTAVPADSVDLAIAVFFLSMLYWLGGICAQLQRGSTSTDQNRERPPLRRPPAKTGSRCLRSQLIMALALWILYPRSWTFATVGFQEAAPTTSFVCGVVAYGLFVLILHFIYWMRGIVDSQADNTMINMAALWPREPRQKLAMWIGVCTLNPITEELLFRGILIYQLGLAIGNLEWPLFLGFFTTLANHAYQGRRSIVFHTLYYVFAVGLLFRNSNKTFRSGSSR